MTETEKAPSGWKIETALSAWQSARARLLDEDSDLARDESALTELLGEAEGDVKDVLARLVRAALHAEQMCEMAEGRAEQIATRAKRYEARGIQMRAVALAMMEALGAKRFEQPDFTMTLAKGRASVVITNEAAIPSTYMRVKTEKTPDKAAMKADMDQGVVIEGAFLSNGMPQLRIKGT
jgi:hypothetical protein